MWKKTRNFCSACAIYTSKCINCCKQHNVKQTGLAVFQIIVFFFFFPIPEFWGSKNLSCGSNFSVPVSLSSAQCSHSRVTTVHLTFLSSGQHRFFLPIPLHGHLFAIIAGFFRSQTTRPRPEPAPGGPEKRGGLPAEGLVPPPQTGPWPRPQQRAAGRSEQPPPQGGPQPPAALPRRGKGGGQHPGARLPGALSEVRRRQPSETESFSSSPPFSRGGTLRGRVRAACSPERGSAAGASGQETALPAVQPPLAIAPAEISGVEGKRAAAGPGSGSLNGLPLAPAAQNGSRQEYYSDHHAERRRNPPRRGGDPPGGERDGAARRAVRPLCLHTKKCISIFILRSSRAIDVSTNGNQNT